MQKIQFVDLPSTDTPIDSTNLNNLQNNVETAIEELKLVYILKFADTAPAECSVGDKYINTQTNKLYTAIATNTWNNGEDPKTNVGYVSLDAKTLTIWTGSIFLRIGYGAYIPSIKNTQDNSVIDAYSCNYINGLHTYSLNENVVGIWYDGRPIYRKVLIQLVNNRIMDFQHGISNLSTIVKTSGILEQDNGYSYPMPYMSETAGYTIEYGFSTTNCYIKLGQNIALNHYAIITIEYTKSSDLTRNVQNRNIPNEEENFEDIEPSEER